MYNEDIRILAKENKVCQWEIAEMLNVSEFTLTRWMRRELSEDIKEEIRRIIRVIVEKRKEG